MAPSKALSAAEIKGIQKELVKATSDGATKDIEVLLSKLKEGVAPTEDLIRSTKIGQAVGKLRNSESSDIALQAKKLVQGWKAVIDKERLQNSSNGSITKGTSSPATAKSSVAATPKGASPSGSASPAPAPPKESNGTPATSVSATSATSSGKKPDFEILREKTRNVCLKLIFDALKLADVDSVSDSQIFSISLAIEASVFKKFCASTDAVNADYRSKMRSLSLNLKDKNNPAFRRKVVRGEFEPDKLVDLTPAEMASEERLAENRSLEQQNMLVAQSAAEQEAETDAFQCGRCKQRKCRYYQKQTRSADEPMTTFVTCTNCNNKWKFC